ncbi:MAG: hypothetical protein KYX69_19605 [Sphingomonas sp.]|uniref:hypothetical protein n=1 Tax=Sphingomonas sp. TaxID=28214 RepID=UPI00263281A0|nr:hypothetical protein [Sphingomonas sp.]MDK2769910.1 hypothetical protein [Sphingomonas sp.]
MTTMTKLKLLGGSALGMILRNAAGEGTAGGEAGDAGGEPKPAETVLFPNENKPADPPAGDPPKEGDKPAGEGTKPEDWKEYENDPAKSDAENAAAKAEHDKTKPADPKADAADKVPEDGKYALTMPEGVEVDSELLAAVSPRFKELGLTQKQAQALTDDFIKVQQERAAKQGETWGNTLQKWADDAKADKEIGGTNWEATVQTSRRAVDRLGTPELKEYLNASGGGNHPELIRFMAKVGAMIKEDNPAAGGAGGSSKPADPAHVLFPSDAPKGG